MKKFYTILRCGDQYNWAYHFVATEHARYSVHTIKYAKHDNINLDGIDAIYIHSPDITTFHAEQLPLQAKEKGIKVIGGYAGNPRFWSKAESNVYTCADLIVTISPQLYQFAKNKYNQTPVIFLPESIDTDFFQPSEFGGSITSDSPFKIGWAGGKHKPIKRCHLLKKLKYPVTIKDDWKAQRQGQVDNPLEEMRDFYQGMDCLVVTSLSECMPRTVLEAMACGLPVIGTDVGSMRILLDKEFIVPVNPEDNTVNEMNKILELFYNNLEYRHKIGKINREKAETYFSWKNNAKLWDYVFAYIIENKIEEAINISQNYVNLFKDEFNTTIVKTEEKIIMPSDNQYYAIIEEIQKHNIRFWLMKSSCLDCIRYQELRIERNKLYLATTQKIQLLDCLKEFNFSINENEATKGDISIIIDEQADRPTKKMPFYKLAVEVPYPVIGYLRKVFGNHWETI